MNGYEAFRRAFESQQLPLAFVDVDALERNIATVRQRADGTPVRVASKSIRCSDILDRIMAEPGFTGVMSYTGDEAVFLAEQGFEDLLVAYPVWDNAEVERVCQAIDDGTTIVLTVDSPRHVERIASVASRQGVTVPVNIDVDMSTKHLGIHFGVRRSDIRTPEAALTLASSIGDHASVSLAGAMGYEAQLAGLPDRSPGENRAVNAVVRLLKRRSRPRIRDRRQAVVDALTEMADLTFVNGGGTGSVEFTVADPAVTEVTVGSGFYAPRLFDFYDTFTHEPAAGYAVEVVRQPSGDIYTCRGGGYVASGPPGVDKAPAPHIPDGAALLDAEGAGEVQTPIRYTGPVDLQEGDPVVMRHAKAGELCRPFQKLHLVRGDDVIETVPTYRGQARAFL